MPSVASRTCRRRRCSRRTRRSSPASRSIRISARAKKGQQVRFFDFENPKNNEFLVTRQYKVKGSKKHIIPDVVCFVKRHPAIVDWTKKNDVQREMRRHIKRKLPTELYDQNEQERVAEAVVDLLKVRKRK